MAVSIIALVIAVCSLAWNIASTVRAWRAAKPDVKVSADLGFPSGHNSGAWLRIDVRNTGGASAAVERIYVWWSYKDKKSLRKDGFGIPGNLPAAHTVHGPDLPRTLTPNHSEHWEFELAAWLGYVLTHIAIPDRLLIEVWMASEEHIQCEIHNLNFDTVIEAYNNATVKPPYMGTSTFARTDTVELVERSRERPEWRPPVPPQE